MIEVLRDDVHLEQPVLVIALSGWVDAGRAGEAATAYLQDHLEDATEVARVDLAEVADLQQTRPVVELVDGVTRKIVWPYISFVAGRAGRDAVVCRGPEPSTGWRELASEVAAYARRLGVERAVCLGGMPVPVSHRRPMGVLATGNSPAVAREVGALRADYVGPTGAQTVVQVALGAAGIPAVGLWAQVPHYLAATLSPVAVRALLGRLREISGVAPDLALLDRQAGAYTEQVEETVSAREDLAELVAQLEAAGEPVGLGERIPTGEEIASEIEEFLRGEG